MKILWITNIKVEQDCDSSTNFRGGWMVGALNFLVQTTTNTIAIAYPENEVVRDSESEVQYYSFSYDMASIRYDEKLCEQFVDIYRDYMPDVIHIWGTEYIHSYAAVQAAKKLNIENRIVVNIQGLVSIYSKHLAIGVSEKNRKCKTLVDLLYDGSINRQIKLFRERGEYEKKVIEQVKNVIGRTTWDKACTKMINPSINYYFCNEILREPFYSDCVWSIENCEPYSIFVSQANYPIKGFHFLIDALGLIKENFPNVKLYIAGECFYKRKSRYSFVKSQYLMNTYEKCLYREICERHLEDNILFLGSLSATQMKERYLKSNVVVSASTIENESNTVSEAKILGVPVVASYVGGVTDRIDHMVDGVLYPCNEPYMLAYYINKIFFDSDFCTKISLNARKTGMVINNRKENGNKLLEIYEQVKKYEG